MRALAAEHLQLLLQKRGDNEEQRAHREHGRQGEQRHVVQYDTDKEVEGIRKKFITVDRTSSGTYCERIFIMDGQKMPTIASNTRKPSI